MKVYELNDLIEQAKEYEDEIKTRLEGQNGIVEVGVSSLAGYGNIILSLRLLIESFEID